MRIPANVTADSGQGRNRSRWAGIPAYAENTRHATPTSQGGGVVAGGLLGALWRLEAGRSLLNLA